MHFKPAIKNIERNHPVKKSIRVRKAKVAADRSREQLKDAE